MKTDFLGNELNLGDEIVFADPSYRNLVKGNIYSMADQSCIIVYNKTINNSIINLPNRIEIKKFRQKYSQIVLIK